MLRTCQREIVIELEALNYVDVDEHTDTVREVYLALTEKNMEPHTWDLLKVRHSLSYKESDVFQEFRRHWPCIDSCSLWQNLELLSNIRSESTSSNRKHLSIDFTLS